MNRTKKLMGTVTTSLLLTGTLPAPLSSALAQTPSKQNDTWKTDPEIGKAADQIFAGLEGVSRAAAKTADEIRKQFPALSASVVDHALMRLKYEKRLKWLGYGTNENPYRYYGFDISHGG